MEGWRQRRPGSNSRNPQGGRRKTDLTLTGLLMEGLGGAMRHFRWMPLIAKRRADPTIMKRSELNATLIRSSQCGSTVSSVR
jgi:hypothetical protein